MERFTVQRLKLDGRNFFARVLFYPFQGLFAVNRVVTLSRTYLHGGGECSVSLSGSAWPYSVRSALSVRTIFLGAPVRKFTPERDPTVREIRL